MKKYPSIERAEKDRTVLSGSRIVVLEKMDGSNARFTVNENDEILFGTRRTKQTHDGEPLPLDEVNNQFQHCYEYLLEKIDISDLKSVQGYKDMTFFGESMHKNHIDYDAWGGKHPDVGSSVPNFIGFDIYKEGEGFLDFDRIQEIYDKLGIDTVPVIYEGSSEGIDWDDFDFPKSKFRDGNPNAEEEFNKKGLAEGVVVRNEGMGKKVKIPHPEFSETNLSFSSPSEEEKEASEFVGKFVTEARVRKIAYKIRDEREENTLKMEFMQELPLRVIDDIKEEESPEANMNDEDVLSEIRSKTSSKCSSILSDLIN